MSFSREVRDELLRLEPDQQCCYKAELAAFFMLKGEVIYWREEGWHFLIGANNPAMARRIYRLIKKSYPIQPRILLQNKTQKTKILKVEIKIPIIKKWIMEQLFKVDYEKKILSFDETILHQVCCQRSFLRANYICGGFINRPEDNYHLELIFNDKDLARNFQKVLNNFDVSTRKIKRKNKWIVYIKDSDKISDLLRIIGANQALLNFENIRIIKSVRNQVNRHVNCETANLAKTVNASLRQIKLINMFIERYGVEKIPFRYRQLALLRLESPDKSLQELGAILNPPLSKSGVAYRMRRIEEFARESLGQF